jgi:4-alpha-glucanotransferase
VITPDVIELRDHYKMPGMRIMQFGFGDSGNKENLPENFPINCVAYTGTHDNPPTRGWFDSSSDVLKKSCLRYLGGNTKRVAHMMIQAIWGSPAVYAIAPMQDFLNLGNDAIMNKPSVPLGNWAWRMSPKSITPKLIEWIKDINFETNRSVKENEE